MRKLFLVFAILFGSSTPAMSVEPSEVLSDPALEERARGISKNLRCLVCQNENIDSSHAPLARDLRVIVRERLVAGDTDEEIYAFVVDRYGDFVLLNPPVQGNTAFLWFAPILFMVIGGAGLFFFLRKDRTSTVEATLSDEEKKKVEDLLG